MLAVCGDNAFALTARGKTAVLSWQRMQSFRDALRMIALLLKSKKLVQFVHKQCSLQKISVTLELCNRPVMRAGDGSRPGRFSRMLGFGPVEIKSIHLFRALIDSARSRL